MVVGDNRILAYTTKLGNMLISLEGNVWSQPGFSTDDNPELGGES